MIISAEDLYPYDRTLLTKILPTADATKLILRPENFLKDSNIDFKLKVKAENINTKEKLIYLNNGEKIVKLISILTLF